MAKIIRRKTFKKLENEEFIRETIAGLDRGGLGLGELVDQMQSQALKFYADSSNALMKVSRESIRRSSRVIADLLDIPKESVDWVSLDRSIDETLPLNASSSIDVKSTSTSILVLTPLITLSGIPRVISISVPAFSTATA